MPKHDKSGIWAHSERGTSVLSKVRFKSGNMIGLTWAMPNGEAEAIVLPEELFDQLARHYVGMV